MTTPTAVGSDVGSTIAALHGLLSTPSPTVLDLGGTRRTRPATDTLAAVRPHFPALGITRLADVTGLDVVGVPVAICVRPNARHLSVSQGKGITRELAMASAAMESIEMHHAEHPPPERLRARWAELDRRAVRPGTFELGVRHGRRRDDLPIGWIDGVDLVSDETVLVPQVLLDLDSTRAHPDTGLFAVSSNGLASGNVVLEAVLHGLYEVIERDADLRFGLLDRAEHERRRLDLTSVEAPLLTELVARLAANPSHRVDAWDATGPTGIPTYRVTLRDTDPWRGLESFVGTGAHRSPVVALSRALTEAAQTRLTLITGSRDDVFPSHYRPAAADRAGRTPELLPGPAALPPSPRPVSLTDELRTVVDAVVSAGHPEVVAVDQSDPMLGIAVVKVIVPTMRMKTLDPHRSARRLGS